MNGLNAAQRQYDNQQSPDYFDTRTDLEIEIDAAKNKALVDSLNSVKPVQSEEDASKWAKFEAKRLGK